MPELPEVEVTRRGLIPHVIDKKITAIYFNHHKLRIEIPKNLLNQDVKGSTITVVDRIAKFLVFRIKNGSTMLIHLGMSGKLGIFAHNTPQIKHDHVIFEFETLQQLRFNDTRRFGSISVWPAKQASTMEEQFIMKQGIEPFSKNYTATNLAKIAKNRKLSVKQFLMNSQIIAGIGNIYANETLYSAAIHPATPACKISKYSWLKIIDNSRKILEKAIKAGGSTIADFIGSSGKPGYFQLQLKVYGQQGNKCESCSGIIEKFPLAGRSCYICPTCQQQIL